MRGARRADTCADPLPRYRGTDLGAGRFRPSVFGVRSLAKAMSEARLRRTPGIAPGHTHTAGPLTLALMVTLVTTAGADRSVL